MKCSAPTLSGRDCGAEVLPATGKGRGIMNYGGGSTPIPDDMPVHTCLACGERYFNSDELAAICGVDFDNDECQ